MTSLKIVPHPHPALRWKSREINRIDAELKQMVSQMFELMYEARGVGLAANQVALPYRLFVINPTGDPEETDQELVFLNPRISRRRGSEEGEEGCLSLPEVHAPVIRATHITVDAFDLTGQQFELELKDFPARVIQHEYDHLEGVLFTDRIAAEHLREAQPLLDDLVVQFRTMQDSGEMAADDALEKELRRLEKLRT